MSRAGAAAGRDRRRLDAWAEKADEYVRADACLVACDRCGLGPIVDSGCFAWWDRSGEEPFSVCPGCGSPYAVFLEELDSSSADGEPGPHERSRRAAPSARRSRSRPVPHRPRRLRR